MPPGHHNYSGICPCPHKQVACRPGKAVDYRPLLRRDDLSKMIASRDQVLDRSELANVDVVKDNQVCTPCIPISLDI